MEPNSQVIKVASEFSKEVGRWFSMDRRAICAFIFALMSCCCAGAIGQALPEFCQKVSTSLLGGLQSPYARQVAPDGSVYCEGLLRRTIGMEPPLVISVKQEQSSNVTFAQGKSAALTWCDELNQPVHVQLRSIKSPLFALDAMHTAKFEWSADSIARWQPDWQDIAALGIRPGIFGGHPHDVVVPLRYGAGYANSYVFVIQSKIPLHLTKVLIEPMQAPFEPVLRELQISSGPTNDTWKATVSFAKLKPGTYAVTFEEGVDQAGNTTEPIYLVHNVCGGS